MSDESKSDESKDVAQTHAELDAFGSKNKEIDNQQSQKGAIYMEEVGVPLSHSLSHPLTGWD